MSFIAQLLGLSKAAANGKLRRAADVERALGNLVDERTVANKAIDAADDERLTDAAFDASDDEITNFDRKTDAQRLVIDRCAAAEPRLVAELEGLRCAARQAR